MDEDDGMSVLDSPIESDDSSAEKSDAILQTYLDSLPYECESVNDMKAKLEYIVGKIAMCAKSRNWLVLTTWDGALQCWLLLRYPIPKPTRAKLARLYYELCILPGLEPRVIRSWADMLSRLLSNKPDQRRKLESNDLQLPWQPLWRVLKRELWPKRRVHDALRNVVNVLLFVAETCRRYFSPLEIPDMLSTFLPMVTQDNILTMLPVMTAFFPPTHTHLYLPMLFKLWEAFNSHIIDDRLLELCGELSEEHVSGKDNGTGEEGIAEWKDIGIWTQSEWAVLATKALGAMNVPVGAVRGASTTGGHADTMADKSSVRITKPIGKYSALAKIFVYSMSLDGPIREIASSSGVGRDSAQQGFLLAGSRALDTLDKLLTSTESFFHPSNTGHWTLALTGFLHRLAVEFCKRWKEEQQSTCYTPVTRRLTPTIKRAFVTILRTPTLLAIFAKDPISATYSQGALRTLAMLEPDLIMPEILERAYSGLELVNETHRTTAILTALASGALPLVSEKVWLGGQKHIAPLLELCIPGIDLNDPLKTACTSMFIASVVQHMKIGDLSMQQGGAPLSGDIVEESMNIDNPEGSRLPDGTEQGPETRLSREEERTLARESTAGFADWVTSLFRRVFALYENLPEEGGKKNTTGGKMEEAVLKSLKGTLDILCLQLSDPLFDLVLKLVYDYGTTNARSNAVRAFGQLVACLARVQPEKVISKFLPYCSNQIREELKHGASSIRTTSTHAAVPSDTTLHWNMAILRGCLGYGGPALLKYKDQVIELLQLLVDKTKGERGYTGTGRLLHRILHTVAGVYPINARFVNTNEWNDPEFDKIHNLHWGRLYEPEDVKIEWHVPSPGEVDFVLEIMDKIAGPALDRIEALLDTAGRWDNVGRNDFCRFLHPVRSMWSGLPTFLKEGQKEVKNPCLYPETELQELLVTPIDVKAGFVLENPSDTRYQRAAAHRARFGNVIHRATTVLQHNQEGEDHIDAVISISKAIDVYLLEYAMTRSTFDSLQQAYTVSRDSNRMWPRQKENSRQVFLKRAQAYHAGRNYLHSLYRRRSELDDKLLDDLVDLSLSPYTRVRRHSQAVFHNACGYFLRSGRYCMPKLLQTLEKGTDPDRMKGALYVLWNKGTASYALADPHFHVKYLRALLECQHQEKPSIQKLVGQLATDATALLTEEAVHTDAFNEGIPGVEAAIEQLATEFSPSLMDQALLAEASKKGPIRRQLKVRRHEEAISSILEFSSRPSTHWRYVQFASKFLFNLIRRDAPVSASLAKFFADHCTSPHSSIRSTAHKAIVKITWHIKCRTFSKNSEDLWREEWKNPLAIDVLVKEPAVFLQQITTPIGRVDNNFYVDKLSTGFLVWAPSVKAYRLPPTKQPAVQWEDVSQPALQAIQEVFSADGYFSQLAQLFGQESNKESNRLTLRSENAIFIKSIAKMYQANFSGAIQSAIDSALGENDRFKQRGAAEMLAGLLRGSKHWPREQFEAVWTWFMERFERIYAQIKPDTLPFWEGLFNEQLSERDYRRTQPLVDAILALPLDFQGDSAFAMSKALTLFNIVVDSCWPCFYPVSDKYMSLFLANANTGYADIRSHIAHNLAAIISEQWRPAYPSTGLFLEACKTSDDPLFLRQARYEAQLTEILKQLPKWKQERFPPPRVNQSQYDKVGLTLLQWIWTAAHGPHPNLVFRYIVILLPEILRMSELNDSSELQRYSSAVLYILSAVNAPPDYVEVVAEHFLSAIKSSDSWRVRLKALPTLLVFIYRNLMLITTETVTRMMDVLLDCLSDENVEVREMASQMLSGVVRCSQRQSIIPLRDRFMELARKTRLPARRDPTYAESLRTLHSAILGLCALIESFPYSVESWMPPLTEILAAHATDPVPVSITIRKCASEFKKTHQDTWHKDQLAFDEDQLQSLSTMLVGTSYCRSHLYP
ncbi:ARM repeat-containing protein [Irpex rosettiformis]|uniref:ARM repeat-containing protein n=1 Tax=Irpex rosettiformis TaxID=378272 RepID=A0ACB8UJN7_9APHY|nr:ARM repeat-containing protein [Irpex rosettiformis]